VKTVLVSGAAGAVGSAVGQIAKIRAAARLVLQVALLSVNAC